MKELKVKKVKEAVVSVIVPNDVTEQNLQELELTIIIGYEIKGVNQKLVRTRTENGDYKLTLYNYKYKLEV